MLFFCESLFFGLVYIIYILGVSLAILINFLLPIQISVISHDEICVYLD